MIVYPDDFVGNKSVVSSIKQILAERRFPRLIIIEGDVGTGRKTLADIIANGAVCTGENAPCGKCSGCAKFYAGHPDVCYIDGGKKKSIGVDDVREAIELSAIVPNEAPRRVFVIRNADGLTVSAQNALLKAVEDGPQNEVFIFAVTSRFNLLETIISRGISFRLVAVLPDEAENYVKTLRNKTLSVSKPSATEKKIASADDELIKRCITLSGGNIGKTLELICGGSDEYYTSAGSLAELLANKKKADFLIEIMTFGHGHKNRLESTALLRTLSEILRDAVADKNSAQCLLHPAFAQISHKLAERYTLKKLMSMQSAVSLSADKIQNNAPVKIQVTCLASVLFAE